MRSRAGKTARRIHSRAHWQLMLSEIPFSELILFEATGGATRAGDSVVFGKHMFFDGGLRLVAEATGGTTRAGDSVVGEVKAW
jgi:hypothetical protein